VRTVAAVVARNARERPDGVAFIEAASGKVMRWSEYDEASSRIGSMFSTAYRPGERMVHQLPDGPDAHLAMLGCEKAGIVAVGIGARAGAREVEHIVGRTGFRRRATTSDRPALSPASAIGPDELWFLNSTSGTTGLPKIVMHNQARWFAFHEYADRAAHFTKADVFCSALPAPFGFGLWTRHFTPAITGAPCVVFDRFSAEAALAAIEEYQVTVLAAVSTQFVMMLNSPALDEYDVQIRKSP